MIEQLLERLEIYEFEIDGEIVNAAAAVRDTLRDRNPKHEMVGRNLSNMAIAQAAKGRAEYGEDMATGRHAAVADLRGAIARLTDDPEVEEREAMGEILRFVIETGRRCGVTPEAMVQAAIRQL